MSASLARFNWMLCAWAQYFQVRSSHSRLTSKSISISLSEFSVDFVHVAWYWTRFREPGIEEQDRTIIIIAQASGEKIGSMHYRFKFSGERSGRMDENLPAVGHLRLHTHINHLHPVIKSFYFHLATNALPIITSAQSGSCQSRVFEYFSFVKSSILNWTCSVCLHNISRSIFTSDRFDFSFLISDILLPALLVKILSHIAISYSVRHIFSLRKKRIADFYECVSVLYFVVGSWVLRA